MTSRSERWKTAAVGACKHITELIETQDEWSNKLDNLPESQQDSDLAYTLQEIVDLDLASALETLEEAKDIALP
jgi:hypothetical protein